MLTSRTSLSVGESRMSTRVLLAGRIQITHRTGQNRTLGRGSASEGRAGEHEISAYCLTGTALIHSAGQWHAEQGPLGPAYADLLPVCTATSLEAYQIELLECSNIVWCAAVCKAVRISSDLICLALFARAHISPSVTRGGTLIRFPFIVRPASGLVGSCGSESRTADMAAFGDSSLRRLVVSRCLVYCDCRLMVLLLICN